VVLSELDIRRNEAWNRWIRAPEQHIFPRSFEIVVDDPERSGAVPSSNSLSVETKAVTVGYVGIKNIGGRAIECYSARNICRSMTVNIATVEYQVMRQQRCVSFRAFPQPDDSIVEHYTGANRKLDSLKPIMV
jgi:hypothetical protein